MRREILAKCLRSAWPKSRTSPHTLSHGRKVAVIASNRYYPMCRISEVSVPVRARAHSGHRNVGLSPDKVVQVTWRKPPLVAMCGLEPFIFAHHDPNDDKLIEAFDQINRWQGTGSSTSGLLAKHPDGAQIVLTSRQSGLRCIKQLMVLLQMTYKQQGLE